MPIALHEPALPALPLEQCSDADRRIAQRCWDLGLLQQDLQQGRRELHLTATASSDAINKLNWDGADVRAFMLALGLHRYQGSEWCLPPAEGNRWGPLPADVFVMGFDRFKGEENPRRVPPVYVKFAVKGRFIIVLSLHPSVFC